MQASLINNDDISEGLFYLYDYCYILLESAEVKNIKDAMSALFALRDTFHLFLKHPLFIAVFRVVCRLNLNQLQEII